jgi:hypothetical protein
VCHPAADVLPLAKDEEFQEMCADVKANGSLNPVRANDENLLIDGCARLQVGWALGLDPAIIRFNPPDVLAYVFSENLYRQSFRPGQRAMIAVKLAGLSHGQGQLPLCLEGDDRALNYEHTSKRRPAPP